MTIGCSTAGGGSDGGGIIAETTSPSTALAVWIPPAPGPLSVISVIAGDSIVTALNAPLTLARGWSAYRNTGCTWTATPPSLVPPAQDVPLVTDTEFAFYLHLEVADRPGVLARVAEILGMQGVSIKSVVQKGLGDEARLVMVMHPVLESKFRAAVQLLAGLDFVREPPRVIRVIEETF